MISIHALREEGDRRGKGQHRCRADFYPRPPRGGRQESSHTRILLENFYPRPPRGGRRKHGTYETRPIHFYPRPPRGGRPTSHALREEGDRHQAKRNTHTAISIHALREEGDVSVRSGRRASHDFYPRPPRGGRRQQGGGEAGGQYISIHALREEGDLSRCLSTASLNIFLSTPSARRATALFEAGTKSIKDFYPRPTRGGRPGPSPPAGRHPRKFLSSPSARSATLLLLF